MIVAVTRPGHQAPSLCEALASRGMSPVHVPLVAVEPMGARESDWPDVHGVDWVVFTSANGVGIGWAAASDRTRGALRGHPRIACVGPGTRRAAEAIGLRVCAMPTAHIAEALADMLVAGGATSVLWVRGEEARDVLRRRLEGTGTSVAEVIAYRTRPVRPDDSGCRALLASDVITLASPSAARSLAQLRLGHLCAAVACIGPVTADAARRLGLRVDTVADTHSGDGLARAAQAIAAARVAPGLPS